MRRISTVFGRIGGSPRLVLLGWLGVYGVTLAVGVLVIAPWGSGSSAVLAKIAADCRSSVDASGVGWTVLPSETRLENVSGEIAVPCRLYFEWGGTLTINGSYLRTKGLTITNEWPVGVLHETFSATRADQGGCCVPNPNDLSTVAHANVVIQHSSLIGVGDTALTILLGSRADALSITDSQLDYPFGVVANIGARVGAGPKTGGGRIDVERSKIHATGDGSFGIDLSTSAPGGATTVADDQFLVEHEALTVYGPACSANNVPGLDGNCRTQLPKKPKPIPPGSSTQNYAAGNVQVLWSGNQCLTDVRFAVSGQPTGWNASGTITASEVPTARCSGELTGHLTCLIVSGNHAVFGGVVDRATDQLDVGNVVFGGVTQNSPESGGEPSDLAEFYEAGSPAGEGSCPPLDTGEDQGWKVVDGTVVVHRADRS